MEEEGVQLPKGVDLLGRVVDPEPHDPERDAVRLVMVGKQGPADTRVGAVTAEEEAARGGGAILKRYRDGVGIGDEGLEIAPPLHAV